MQRHATRASYRWAIRVCLFLVERGRWNHREIIEGEQVIVVFVVVAVVAHRGKSYMVERKKKARGQALRASARSPRCQTTPVENLMVAN